MRLWLNRKWPYLVIGLILAAVSWAGSCSPQTTEPPSPSNDFGGVVLR